MRKVDAATRLSHSTQLANLGLSTCRYTLHNGSPRCTERPRQVIAENIKKTWSVDGRHDVKAIMIVREPAADRGTSLLIFEYSEVGRENDNWIYLPALGRVNRIVASDDEGGSVFGTEFSVESIQNPEARKLDEYTYTILREEEYQGRQTWVVEILPTPERARRTSFEKVVSWVDQEHFLVLKEDYHRNGRIEKQRTQSGLEQIDDVMVVTKVVINNLSTSRISQLHKSPIRHNTKVEDEFLSQRALTDFAFRERHLASFRAALNHSGEHAAGAQ